jgi:hypothetical protein
MIELKPNSEYASLFVNCPRNDSSSSTDITSHVLRISEQSIMLTDGDEKTDGLNFYPYSKKF